LGAGARYAPRRSPRRDRRDRDARLHPEGCRRHEEVPRRGRQVRARVVRSHALVADRALGAAVTRFAALLRAQALPVTLIQVLDAVRALDHLDITDRDELYLGFRTVFVSRPEEAPIFDRCFHAFWRLGDSGESEIPGLVSPSLSAEGPLAI